MSNNTSKLQSLEKNDLPVGWVWTTLGEITINYDSMRVPVKNTDREKKTGIYPYYGASGIIDYVNEYLFEGGYLLIGEDGANLLARTKPIAFIANGKFWVNNHAHILKTHEDISLSYLEHFINSTDLQRFVNGTAQPKLTQISLNKIPIPLAPLAEQNRIVSKVEELFTKLDICISSLKNTKVLLGKYRQSVLKCAFEGELTRKWRENHKNELDSELMLLDKVIEKKRDTTKEENTNLSKLPKRWIWIACEDIAVINPKGINRDIQDDTEVSFVPMKYVGELTGAVDLSHTKRYREVKKGYTPIINEDIIFAKITPCMENGKVAVINNLKNGVGFGSTEFHVIRLHNRNLPRKYYFFYLLQDNLREDARRNMTGSAGQLRVPSSYIKNILIPFPPLLEQYKIVEEVEHHFSVLENNENIIEYTLKQSERLRQSILKRAFEGKLVPQDPIEEPGSILLQKIREKRASHDPKFRKRSKEADSKQIKLT